MIAQPLVVVTGKYYVDDDIIFCDRLQFVGPAECTLVILPKKGTASGEVAPPGPRRLLKIVAGTVDASLSAGKAKISYNLDNDITVPLLDNGLDPETPPLPVVPPSPGKGGGDGSPNFSLGPLPPASIASPSFDPILDPLHYIGSYPKAISGGDGAPGGKGGKGVNGMNGPVLEIWTTQILGNVAIDLRGQPGGDGGHGGNGQGGGNGQMGAAGATGTDTTWLGVPNLTCKQGPGLGGDGGRGGNAGCGGDGGDGGKGGVVNLFYTSGVNPASLSVQVNGGKGGQVGTPGSPGKGGKSGPPGVNVPPCIPALTSQDGPDGNSCRSSEGKQGGVSQPGTDGQDGAYHQTSVQAIPKVPGLPF